MLDGNANKTCKTELSLYRMNELSKVFDNSFLIFKEDYSLHIYGESLTKWLSIGGLIKGDVQITWEKGAFYYNAGISSVVFFRFILDQRKIFEVFDIGFGYKVEIKSQ